MNIPLAKSKFTPRASSSVRLEIAGRPVVNTPSCCNGQAMLGVGQWLALNSQNYQCSPICSET